MNPTIAIILALLRNVDPKDIKVILAAVVSILDPIMANKGPIIRAAWAIIKKIIPSDQFAGELNVAATQFVQANPSVMGQIHDEH